MTTRPHRLVSASAAAALCVSAAAAVVGTADPAAAKVKAPVWTQVSSGSGISISAEPTVVRWGQKLVVVWPRQVDSLHSSVFSRVLSASGKSVTPIGTVVDSWSTVPSDPRVLLLGGVPTVAMAGYHSTVTTDPLNGPILRFSAADASSWALQPGSLTHTQGAYGDYGYGVVDNGAGVPISAGAYSSTDHVTVHYGIDPAVPAAAPDLEVAGTGLSDIDDVSVVRDSKTGAVYALWNTLSGPPAQQGVHGAQIYPGIGAPSPTAPFSLVSYQGVPTNVDPGQNVAVASRIGGGVWAAYTSGYPSPRTIVLWNLTTGRTLKLHTGGAAQYVSLSAGPGGRLWVSWVQGSTVYATRTNPAVTKFGVVRAAPAPGGYSPTRLTGDGTLGPLDAVITQAKTTPNAQVLTAHLFEGLRVGVAPAKVSYAAGGTVVVTVTDAGVPVPGVYVKVGGAVKKTGASGKASFTIAKHAAKGAHVVTAYGTGWWPGSASFKVG